MLEIAQWRHVFLALCTFAYCLLYEYTRIITLKENKLRYMHEIGTE